MLADWTPDSEVIARRRRLGQDAHDEIWQGEYHMVPGPHLRHGLACESVGLALAPWVARAGLRGTTEFNIGKPDDFRVPDRGYHRPPVPDELYLSTAALVVEVLSPGDESWAKLGFFAAHGVDEVLIVDPGVRTLHWLIRHGQGYEPTAHSDLLDVDVAEVAAAVRW